MLRVKETEGVINVVSWLNKPAVIREEEIKIIKEFLNEYTDVKIERTETSVHDLVRVVNGPFSRFEGNILEISKNKVKVYLESLGYTMVVEVNRSNLELVKKSAHKQIRSFNNSRLNASR